MGDRYMISSYIKINGELKKHGTVTEDFINAIVQRNLGQKLIGYINKLSLWGEGGTFIKDLTNPEILEYSYDEVNKQYTVHAQFKDTSTDSYTIVRVEAFSYSPQGELFLSLFDELYITKDSAKHLVIDYYIIITHDDYNKFHCEQLAKELINIVVAMTYRIVKVKVYDKTGNFVKEVTEKYTETMNSGYKEGKYYASHHVEFRDGSKDEYEIGKVEYIDEHGNVYIKHENLDYKKLSDQVVYFVLIHDNVQG